MNQFCVILTTCGSVEESEAIATGLIEARLAACVQQTPIRSVYRWEGRVVQDEELLLLIKTQSHLYSRVEAWIKAHHSYDTPEIIQLPVVAGLSDYLQWIDSETGP